jgi:hypothetical protein
VSATPQRPRHDVFPAWLDGESTLVVAPQIPDDAPTAVREGLARRRLVNAGGTCPCGARMQLPNRATRRQARREGRVTHVSIEHDDDCPAVTANLNAAMAGGR